MRKTKLFLLIVLVALFMSSCSTLTGLFKQKISVYQAVNYKNTIDNTKNPAKQYIITDELENKRVVISKVIVKEVSKSSNIDYDFSVIVDVEADGGTVECYIYSTDIKTMSDLVPGQTYISVEGDFSRFFTMLDDSYVKLEIINATIKKL